MAYFNLDDDDDETGTQMSAKYASMERYDEDSRVIIAILYCIF